MAKRMINVEVQFKDGKNEKFEIDTAQYKYTVTDDYFLTWLKDDTDTVVGIVNLKEVKTLRTRMVER